MSDLDLDAADLIVDLLVNARWWVGNLHSATSGATSIIEDLVAEVENLRANQMPPGGVWGIGYGRDTGSGALWCQGEDCDGPEDHEVKRRVWYGPAEAIALKSTESAATSADVESPTDG